MLPLKGTILLEFQLFLEIPAVLTGSIIAPFTLGTLHSYQFNHLFFACHIKPLIPAQGQNCLKNPGTYSGNRTAPSALNQNRTDDLILTMDVLCQLSYKGL